MNKSRSVRSGQNSEARAVVLSGQLPLQLGQQAVAVHQVREEEEQLSLGQGLAQTHLQPAGIIISVHRLLDSSYPLPNGEGYEVLVPAESPLLVYEPLRPEHRAVPPMFPLHQ